MIHSFHEHQLKTVIKEEKKILPLKQNSLTTGFIWKWPSGDKQDLTLQTLYQICYVWTVRPPKEGDAK